MFEGTQRGMPRKWALFGPGCSESESPVSDVVEAQTGSSAWHGWHFVCGVGLNILGEFI